MPSATPGRLESLLADLTLFQQAGDEESQARCLHRIGRALLDRGQAVAAVQTVRLGLAAAADTPRLRAPLYALVGEVLLARRHYRLARAFFGRAAATYREAGAPVGSERAAVLTEALLAGLGGLEELEAARARAREQMEAAHARGDRLGFAAALVVMGELDALDEHFEGCRLCAQAALDALELREGRDQPLSETERRLIADGSSLLGRALAAQGEVDVAVAPLKRAVSLREASQPALLARDLEWLGYARSGLGQLAEARASYAQALKLREQADLVDSAAAVALSLGEASDKNPAEATRFLITAVELLARSSRPPPELIERARTLLRGLPKSHLLNQLETRLGQLLGKPATASAR